MKPKWEEAYDQWLNEYYTPYWFGKYMECRFVLNYVFKSSGELDDNEVLYLRELFCREYFKE
jgi:hypothetical protein